MRSKDDFMNLSASIRGYFGSRSYRAASARLCTFYSIHPHLACSPFLGPALMGLIGSFVHQVQDRAGDIRSAHTSHKWRRTRPGFDPSTNGAGVPNETPPSRACPRPGPGIRFQTPRGSRTRRGACCKINRCNHSARDSLARHTTSRNLATGPSEPVWKRVRAGRESTGLPNAYIYNPILEFVWLEVRPGTTKLIIKIKILIYIEYFVIFCLLEYAFQCPKITKRSVTTAVRELMKAQAWRCKSCVANHSDLHGSHVWHVCWPESTSIQDSLVGVQCFIYDSRFKVSFKRWQSLLLLSDLVDMLRIVRRIQ